MCVKKNSNIRTAKLFNGIHYVITNQTYIFTYSLMFFGTTNNSKLYQNCFNLLLFLCFTLFMK